MTSAKGTILAELRRHITELTEVETVAKQGSATELARHYIDVRNFYEALHEVSKELTKLKDLMAYVDVPAAFEREGTTTLTLRDGYRVTISALVRASTKDMETGIAWCKLCECGHSEVAHGNGINSVPGCDNCLCRAYNAPNAGLVKETINAQTLAAFVRAEMEEGREVPDDIFTVHVGQNTSVTKVK
jgi:hypothetical protein